MVARTNPRAVLSFLITLSVASSGLAQSTPSVTQDGENADPMTAIVSAQRTVYDALFADEYSWPGDAILRIDENLCEAAIGAVSLGTNNAGEEFVIELLDWLAVNPAVAEDPVPQGDHPSLSSGLLLARLSNSAGAVLVLATFLSYEAPGMTPVNNLMVTRATPAPASPSADNEPHYALGLIGGVLAGAIVCYNTTQLCIADALTAHGDYVRGCETQLDDPDQRNECLDCCQAKFDQDVLNCMLSCGANGPDGDYHYCWELMQ